MHADFAARLAVLSSHANGFLPRNSHATKLIFSETHCLYSRHVPNAISAAFEASVSVRGRGPNGEQLESSSVEGMRKKKPVAGTYWNWQGWYFQGRD